jgi:hypothetical protein
MAAHPTIDIAIEVYIADDVTTELSEAANDEDTFIP